jgi:hypothetical protein
MFIQPKTTTPALLREAAALATQIENVNNAGGDVLALSEQLFNQFGVLLTLVKPMTAETMQGLGMHSMPEGYKP